MADADAVAPKTLTLVPTPSFVVRRFVEAAQVKRDLAINPSDVSNVMLEHASRFIEYGTYLSQASKQVNDLTMVFEAAEGRTYKRYRDAAATAGEKVTEAQLEKLVRVDGNVIAYRRLLNEAKQIESLAKSAVDAFRQRKDMLVSYGLMQREEMKGEVSINRRNAFEAEKTGLRDRMIASQSRPETTET